MVANRYKISFGDDDNVLELLVIVAEFCEYARSTEL